MEHRVILDPPPGQAPPSGPTMQHRLIFDTQRNSSPSSILYPSSTSSSSSSPSSPSPSSPSSSSSSPFSSHSSSSLSSPSSSSSSPAPFSLGRRVRLFSVMLALEGFGCFAEIFCVAVLRRESVPTSLVSLPGVLSTAAGVWVLPLVGWASDRLRCPCGWGQKRPYALLSLAGLVTGVALLVAMQGLALRDSLLRPDGNGGNVTVINGTDVTIADARRGVTLYDSRLHPEVNGGNVTIINETDVTITDAMQGVTLHDSLLIHPDVIIINADNVTTNKTDVTPSNVGPSFPVPQWGGVSGVTYVGWLAILGFALTDHFCTSGMTTFRSYMVAVTPAGQQDAMMVLGTLLGAVGGCLTSLLGFVDLASWLVGSGVRVDKGVFQCLVQASVLLTLVVVLGTVSLLTGSELSDGVTAAASPIEATYQKLDHEGRSTTRPELSDGVTATASPISVTYKKLGHERSATTGDVRTEDHHHRHSITLALRDTTTAYTLIGSTEEQHNLALHGTTMGDNISVGTDDKKTLASQEKTTGYNLIDGTEGQHKLAFHGTKKGDTISLKTADNNKLAPQERTSGYKLIDRTEEQHNLALQGMTTGDNISETFMNSRKTITIFQVKKRKEEPAHSSDVSTQEFTPLLPSASRNSTPSAKTSTRGKMAQESTPLLPHSRHQSTPSAKTSTRGKLAQESTPLLPHSRSTSPPSAKTSTRGKMAQESTPLLPHSRSTSPPSAKTSTRGKMAQESTPLLPHSRSKSTPSAKTSKRGKTAQESTPLLPHSRSKSTPSAKTSTRGKMAAMCVMAFLGFSTNYAYFMYVINYVGEVLYRGDPFGDADSDVYRRYLHGVRVASLGMTLFYCLMVVFNLLHGKVMAKVGMRVEVVVSSAGCVLLMLALIFTTNVVVFFATQVAMVAYRSAVYTVPYILANKYSQQAAWPPHGETSGSKSSGGGGGFAGPAHGETSGSKSSGGGGEFAGPAYGDTQGAKSSRDGGGFAGPAYGDTPGAKSSGGGGGFAMALVTTASVAAYLLLSTTMGPLLALTGNPATPIWFALASAGLGMLSTVFVKFD